MSKYIIELDDRIKLVTSVGVTENGVVYTTSDYVHNLEELNSDYINEHYGELQDTAYQRGLEDAWEAAWKIVVDTDNGGIALGTLGEIFGTQAYSCIMRDNTAQEAIDKIKAYEDKQKDSIEVGDEVQAPCGIATVTSVKDDFAHYFYSDGDVGCMSSHSLKKTGKHYDIASILEAMRK